MDKLAVYGIKLHALIGTHQWEQHCRQYLHVDMILQTAAQQIAQSDDLQGAINYDALIEHIFHFNEAHHFQLIETFADRLANDILQSFPTQWIQITVHKPGASQHAKDIAITVERSK